MPALVISTSRLVDIIAVVLIGLASLSLVSLRVHANPKLSIFDEMVHYDYMYELNHGILVRRGDKVSVDSMAQESCRGIEVPGLIVPKCGTAYSPDAYPNLGYNTADSHPPLYYFITGRAAQLLVSAGAAKSLFTAARIVGALWLTIGLAFVWLSAKQLGASVPARTAVVSLLLATGAVIQMSSIVNPDAASMAAGALVLWVVLKWESGGSRRYWVLAITGAVAVLLKELNILAVLAAATYLAFGSIAARNDGTSKWRRHAAAAVVLSVAAFAVELAWLLLQHARGLPGITYPMDRFAHHDHLPLQWVLARVPDFVYATGSGALNWLIIGGCFGAVVVGTATPRIRELAFAGAAWMLIGSPLLIVETWIVARIYLGGPVGPRFSMSLWPLLVVVAAAAITRSRLVTALTLAVAFLELGGSVALLLGHPLSA